MIKSKNIICFLLLVFVLCSLSGCGKSNKHGSKKSDDGRSYGGLVEGTQGDTLHTAFFDLTVDETMWYTTYQFNDGLYDAPEGNKYLLVTVTIKNTYARDLSMSITDFVLSCNDDTPIYGYGKIDIDQDEMMNNVFSLKKGDEITKSILYVVPDSGSYQLTYTEYYSDDFVGDSFVVKLNQEEK
ncbi:MAG: DUF4352 domain-containing protein [Lachnospiraceae bacterium]